MSGSSLQETADTTGTALEGAWTPRDRMVDHLRQQWIGPAGGEQEVLTRSPIYAYLVGTLYPVETGTMAPTTVLDEDLSTIMDSTVELDESPSEGDGEEFEPGDEPLDEDEGLNLTGAFGWAPQSIGMSFIHDGSGVFVSLRAGAYSRVSAESASQELDPASRVDESPGGRKAASAEVWKREQLEERDVVIPNTPSGRIDALHGRARIAWRTRRAGEKFLTTVAVSNSATTGVGQAKADATLCLFQLTLECRPREGRLLPYPTNSPVNSSPEDRELELRYRDKLSFGIGHGTAVSWNTDVEVPETIRSESVPSQEVPAIRARTSSSPFLEISRLADESTAPSELAAGLREFAAGYRSWLHDSEGEASSFASRFRQPADNILARIGEAQTRIEEGISLLERGGSVLTSFQLANSAMREQMLQQRLAARMPGELGEALPTVSGTADEPRWRPFQLGFILLSLSSAVEAEHDDREVVDLIWFPTGGGKTEAYLGLAAIEMIRRRLDHGIRGGGTAVITRYTMRLLTAQQFQRAATLICALELLRKHDPRLSGTPAFSIGLWIGNSTTPATFKQAALEMKSTYKDAVPENRFQLRQCPWCGTSVLPSRRTARLERYGVRATNYDFAFFCPHPECAFNAKLPIQVVDEAIYQSPPTMLVATVDKFARLAWIEKGGSMFGLGGVTYEPPSLVIQDELHLITGPLGTVVGVYEAAIRGLMSWAGTPPKVIASTATTRSADAQVRELMASRVAVFPPSGLNADDNYFSEPDPDTPGRLYIGVMPQAHTPSWALGQISTELLQAPIGLDLTGAARDAYWTLVVYHNSLRELGRTVTILRDDVRSALDRLRITTTTPARELARDGIEELNGNVKADELLRILDQLAIGPDTGGGVPLDALATTNIMSVGIDVSRLGLMLVNGQPKSTSEYIQATSRVGRGTTPGLVVTMFRSGKPRDRSVFESFGTFHRSFYRFVEPSSVTPWSLQARRRALRAALVILVRHAGGLTLNDDARLFDVSSATVKKAIALISAHVGAADPREAAVVRNELELAAEDWDRHARKAREGEANLKYRSREPSERLLKQFTDEGLGWPTMNSMRSVDRVVRIRADGERR